MPDKLKNLVAGRTGEKNEEAQYINDRRAALLLHSPRGARLLLYMIFAFIAVFVVWAFYANIDETVKGMGKVVPAGRIQQIQHLEGGVVQEIHVQEGQTVEKGQLLVVIRDVQFASSITEREAEYYGLLAKRERLSAESKGSVLNFPDDVKKKYPSFVKNEMRQYKANQKKLENDIGVFKARKRQQVEEKQKLEKQRTHAISREKISSEKLAKMQRLVKRGSVSEMDVIQAQEEVDDWVSKKETLAKEIEKASDSIQEIEQSIHKVRTDSQAAAGDEHNTVAAKLRSLKANLTGLTDKEARTRVTSPVKGVVNRINITTIGGVVRAGMTLLEIVPLEDKLVIEARIAPKDIGFLRTDMMTKVKITAYSFATYGGLAGKLKNISADAITNPKGKTFFMVRVETERTDLGTPDHPLPIIPGMQAEVDIIVDRKTVLNYLLKPVLKARKDFVTPGE